MSWPGIQAESGEQSTATALPMSVGVPMRPIGVQPLACQSRPIAWISLGRPLKTLSSVRPGLAESRQQYYIHAPSSTYIAVWDSALKGYAPNLWYGYGGRLVTAWLER
jgi:hypothetical protein